jgi:hypothetical protein
MLTVDSIMRGPKLVGNPPSAIRWSKGSDKVYFSWQKPADTRSSTYVVNRDGTGLKALTTEEARSLDVQPAATIAPGVGCSPPRTRHQIFDAASGARRFVT